MPQTIQLDPAEVELSDLQLFPAEPPVAAERLLVEEELPYELPGLELEAVLPRIVERFGLPQRLLVAPADDEGDGAYRVLDDGRWLQAAREAGMDRIPVRVLPLAGRPADLLALILNQPRPANVAAQVDALERLLAAGVSEGEIGRATGISRARLRRLSTLAGLDPVLRGALRESRIKPPVALAAVELAADAQALLAATFEREGRLTSGQVRQLRDQLAAEDRERAAPDEPVPDAPAARGQGEDPATRVRRHARDLLHALHEAELPLDLSARLAAVLEDIERSRV